MRAIQHLPGLHRLPAALTCMLSLVVLFAAGCRPEEPPAAAPQATGMRIVCLSPAVTDLLLALDLGDQIVGRDTWEDQLSESVPRVGDLTSVDLEAVLSLSPTDVVLQAGNLGAPPRLAEIADERGWNLINLQIDGLADIRHAVAALVDQLSYHGEPSRREAVLSRAGELTEALDDALVAMPEGRTEVLGPVLLLYFTDPPSAFGPGSYVSDILVALGGRNAVSGGAWQELDLERLAALNPWALIIVQPDADGATVNEPQRALGSLARLELECVRAGRLAILRHPQAQLPGASAIGVARELRSILDELAMAEESSEP